MSRKNNSAATGSALQFGLHNMGFKHLTTLDFGRIQPVIFQSCVPNDEINLNFAEAVVTTAPNSAPIQGKIKMNMAAFYVPERVVWPNANQYHTGMINVTRPSFALETLRSIATDTSLTDAQKTDRLAFYSSFGIDPAQRYWHYDSENNATSLKANICKFRAYNRVWWDWFRDANVIPDTQIDSYIYSGNDSEQFATYYSEPKYACWEKDFLTNNLRTPNGDSRNTANTNSSVVDATGATAVPISSSSGNARAQVLSDELFGTDLSGSLKASSMTSGNNSTINSIRVANAIQNWLEKANTLGGRVRDRLRGMFGSSVQPETLQMSEFLRRVTFDINFETSAAGVTSGDTTQFDMDGFGNIDVTQGTVKGQLSGQSTMTKNGIGDIKYHVKEHGYFVVVAWVMPDAMVYQGLNPDWLAGVDGLNYSRWDFPTPEMMNTGFEPMYLYEASLPTNTSVSFNRGTYNPFIAIGYRGRYSSWTYNRDILSGAFIDPRFKTSMRNWALVRDLRREAGVTDADDKWIDSKTGTDFVNGITHDTLSSMTRTTKQAYDDKFIVSNSSVDHFVCQFNIDMQMTRPIPAVTVPRIETVTASPSEFGGTRL